MLRGRVVTSWGFRGVAGGKMQSNKIREHKHHVIRCELDDYLDEGRSSYREQMAVVLVVVVVIVIVVQGLYKTNKRERGEGGEETDTTTRETPAQHSV